MCSINNGKQAVLTRKYLILFCAFFIGIISFVVILIHSTKNVKDNGTFPIKQCAASGSITQVYSTVKNLTHCRNNYPIYNFHKRNNYYILYNYVMALKRFDCEESVTYATHADYSFLDNVQPLLENWKGPISLAIHAPGTDFYKTLNSIIYLRSCIPFVKEFVTFHLYFHEHHSPDEIPQHVDVLNMTSDCLIDPPFKNVNRQDMYVKENNLTYPINMGRNVARSMSQTHFVFTSDIELYPNPNVISEFLKLFASCGDKIKVYNPVVFVVHIFEIEKGLKVPPNKTDLVRLLDKGMVIPFHKNICAVCHTIPMFDEWKKTEESDSLKIFNIGKRTGKYYHWEPIYIGTNAEPEYDERLSWEGMKDKVVQGYEMCLMNYTFLILDNAFLVHKPGIKKLSGNKDKWRKKYIQSNNKLIKDVIMPSINKRFKITNQCQL
ncbi:hypothetical protein FQA39_LY18326 [Lamprigera yunnana]|nr:hypothetical protein FQA39_LY18326 [Lamprigera yunnana]